ncbi:putative transcriptional regulatory protein [Klebsiella quasipneumoniae]|nr:putative transcriptional regulatory protein [Klebsiella quasipneumoniae]
MTWGKDMDDALLFNGCIINQEIIFNANMNELRSLTGNGECVSLNAPTARCLLLLLQNKGKVISRDEFLGVRMGNTGRSGITEYVLSKYLFAEKIAGQSWAV